jgi:hypothetical protein
MTRKRATRTIGIAAAVAATALALLAAGAPVASAEPAATQTATDSCWLQVVNDWLHNGQVTGLYAIPCYTQAIQHLSAYPDISQYSSAIEDIHRALLAAVHEDRGNGPGGSLGGGGLGPGSGGLIGGGGGGGGGGGSGGTGSSGGAGSALHKGLFARVAQDIGPGNAESIPLPLLVLGGLALLLLLTAAATWLARRMQARRLTAQPAPAHARSSVRPKT